MLTAERPARLYDYTFWQQLELLVLALGFNVICIGSFTVLLALKPGSALPPQPHFWIALAALVVALVVSLRLEPLLTLALTALLPCFTYIVWFMTIGHSGYLQADYLVGGAVTPLQRLLELTGLAIIAIRAPLIVAAVRNKKTARSQSGGFL